MKQTKNNKHKTETIKENMNNKNVGKIKNNRI